MTLKLLHVLRFSLLSGMFLLLVRCEAQLPDTSELPINYDYNYIENDSALDHLKTFFNPDTHVVSRALRILYLGDSHVKSGYLAETFATILDTMIRQYNPVCSGCDTIPQVELKVMAKNGAMAKTLIQSVYIDTIVKSYNPDLVIISLGTNEAYNGLNPDTLAYYQELLISKVKTDAPGADILITTPGDGLKKYYTRVRVSKKKRKYRKVVHYKTNEYLLDVIDYYLTLPEKYNVALWNFYPVMGGEESIKEWSRLGYAQKDMIHLTREGYYLEARLLALAMKDVIDGRKSVEE